MRSLRSSLFLCLCLAILAAGIGIDVIQKHHHAFEKSSDDCPVCRAVEFPSEASVEIVQLRSLLDAGFEIYCPTQPASPDDARLPSPFFLRGPPLTTSAS